MFNSPITGNNELDAFLSDVKSLIGNTSDNGLSANLSTGVISDNTNNTVISYLYRYINIKFADDTVGTNISDNPSNKSYFGVYNTNTSVESVNPANYTWYAASGGFSTTKSLWILVGGGRSITFAVSELQPDNNINWRVAPVRSVDLDAPIVEYSQYMSIRYADDAVGTGFSVSPINKKYYGVFTSSLNKASSVVSNYEWTPFNFGTTNELYYRCFGGRSITISCAVSKPLGHILYLDGAIINLDVPTYSTVTSLGVISEIPAIVESPYRYLLLRYGTDNYGAGFSTSYTGKTHFGLQSSSVLTIDDNPADYVWFDTAGTLGTTSALWVRTTGNYVEFNFDTVSPDGSGWKNALDQTNVFLPYIDIYLRSGVVVTNINSPTDGRLYNSVTNADGTTTVSLAPYGQGSSTNGYTINPAATASISIDQFGRVLQSGAIDEIRYSSTITTATAGQTAFAVTNNQPNQIMVFRTGLFLHPGQDYTRTNTTVTLSTACVVGDSITIYYIRLIDATTSLDKVPFTTQQVTLTAGQTVVSNTYLDGSEMLFLNGVLVVDSDYSYSGSNTGYILKTPVTGGKLSIVLFSVLNTDTLLFGENYTETISGVSLVTFPTGFYRNSSLIWLNGVHLKPTTDYTIPGASDIASNYNIVGGSGLSGQPSQFMTIKSAGPAAVGSVGSMGVLGMDQPVVIDQKPTMLDMFKQMQDQIHNLQAELFYIRNK